MSVVAYQITQNSTVCATVYSATHQIYVKAPHHWPFVRGIHRAPMSWPHKGIHIAILFCWNTLRPFTPIIVHIKHKYTRGFCHVGCSRRSQTPNTKLLERVYSQIRRHMIRHKHIGPTRWHHKEDDEDVEHDEHEHDDHGDAKRDQTWRH